MVIREFSGFLSNNECLGLIKSIEPELKPVGVLGNPEHSTRIAKGKWFEKHDSRVKRLVKKISNITGYPVKNLERPHIVRYEAGGEYQPHHDFFHPEQDYAKKEFERGGQRVKSFLIYLNDGFTGGETEFPDLGIKIKPEKKKSDSLE